MQKQEYIQKYAHKTGKSQLSESFIESWDRKSIPEKAVLLLGISSLNGKTETTDILRHELYSYAPHDNKGSVVDLGNIISLSHEDQYEALTSLLQEVKETKSVLLILSEDPSFITGLFEQKNDYQKEGVTIIDSQIETEVESLSAYNYFKQGFINDLFYIGTQSYYQKMQLPNNQNQPQIFRLGQLRDNLQEAEPFFRQSKSTVFNFRAVRFSDFPDNPLHSPNGMYAEEFCRLGWFAGNSDTVSTIALTGFDFTGQYSPVSVSLLAQTTWYIINGILTRKDDDPLNKPGDFKQYHIENNKFPEKMVIYKSIYSNKYWMCYGSKKQFIPCTKNDMEQIMQNQIPDRMLKNIKKI